MNFRAWLEGLRRFGNQGMAGPIRKVSIRPIANQNIKPLYAILQHLNQNEFDGALRNIEALKSYYFNYTKDGRHNPYFVKLDEIYGKLLNKDPRIIPEIQQDIDSIIRQMTADEEAKMPSLVK